MNTQLNVAARLWEGYLNRITKELHYKFYIFIIFHIQQRLFINLTKTKALLASHYKM